jgi:hypothetical protein
MRERWYWKGRTARANGESRELPDGRVNSGNRLEFYRGWDEEDRLRRPATAQDVEKSKAVLAKLREFAATL